MFSFLVWSIRSVVFVDRIRFVRGHLLRRQDAMSGSVHPAGVDDAAAMVRFVDDYLRVDGVFLLRLIAHNTNGVAAADITLELWNEWYERRQSKQAEAGSVLTVPRRQPAVE